MKVPGLLARHGSRQRSRWHASNTQRSPSHPQSYHHYHQPQSLHAALEARLGCVTRRNVRTSTVFEQAPRASRNKATPEGCDSPVFVSLTEGPFFTTDSTAALTAQLDPQDSTHDCDARLGGALNS